MTAIEILIQRIGAKLFELNLSEREVSLAATGKPDAVRYIRTRRAMPGAERLRKIADVLETTPEWLLGSDEAASSTSTEHRPLDVEVLQKLPRNLPVYGTALGVDLDVIGSDGSEVAVEQTEINMVEPRDYMGRPTSIAGKDGYYVVIVAGRSMVPRYDQGRKILVNGKARANVEDHVIVQLKKPLADGEEWSSILIKRLVKRRADRVTFAQYTPPIEFDVPTDRIFAIHPVVEWDDVIGI